jgi:hypothetical protein
MKRLLYLFFFCGVATGSFAQCSTFTPSINVSSSSISESPPTFLSNQIGSDYPSTSKDLIIPQSGTFTISISNANTCSNWVLSVRTDNTTGLRFYVQRTNDGGVTPPPGASISGGLNFLELTAVNQPFFNGVKDRYFIQIRYKITGISVIMPASNYLSNITFSITGS